MYLAFFTCVCYTKEKSRKGGKGKEAMEFYIVRIEGDYAYLRPVEVCSMCEDYMVALALLPEGADLHSRIRFEAGEYELV